MSITGYLLGEVFGGHADRGTAPQKLLGTEIFIENPPARGFSATVDPRDLRRQIVSLLRLRPSSGMLSFSPRPQGRLETHTACRPPANALPLLCFPDVHR
jgi:hypothetical protein